MSPTATRIKNEVVAKNPNVRMVLSGHVHGAMKNQHFFDVEDHTFLGAVCLRPVGR